MEEWNPFESEFVSPILSLGEIDLTLNNEYPSLLAFPFDLTALQSPNPDQYSNFCNQSAQPSNEAMVTCEAEGRPDPPLAASRATDSVPNLNRYPTNDEVLAIPQFRGQAENSDVKTLQDAMLGKIEATPHMYVPPSVRTGTESSNFGIQNPKQLVTNKSKNQPKLGKKKKNRRKRSKNKNLKARKRKKYRENLKKPTSELSLLKRRVNRARNRTVNLLGHSFEKAKEGAILIAEAKEDHKKVPKETIDRFVKIKRDQALYKERSIQLAQSHANHQQFLVEALNKNECSVPKLMTKERAEKEALKLYKNKNLKF